MKPCIRFVDAHFHLWDLDKNYYPWLSDGNRSSVVEDYSSLRRNYVLDDFQQETKALDPKLRRVAAVHIQAEHDPADHVRETRWLQEIADTDTEGLPNAIIANADLAAKDVQSVLEQHCQHRNMRGIRQALHRRLNAVAPYDPLEDPAFQKNFSLLERYGLSFDLQFFQSQGEAVAELVRRHPRIQFILTHCGMPLSHDDAYLATWKHNVCTLAQFPNVAVKISGFGLWRPAWDVSAVTDIGGFMVELFTPARCMLASNFPVERIHKRYEEVWHAYLEAFSSYSSDERDAIFAGNALRYYRISTD